MRGADLLRLPVVGLRGQDLGRVVDVRLVQDGPLLGTSAAFRVQGFVVGRRTVASRLGYDRATSAGPWPVMVAVRWWTRHNRYLAWEDCALEDGQIRSLVEQLPEVPAL